MASFLHSLSTPMRFVIETVTAGNFPIYYFLFLDAPIFPKALSGMSYHYLGLIIHVCTQTMHEPKTVTKQRGWGWTMIPNSQEGN